MRPSLAALLGILVVALPVAGLPPPAPGDPLTPCEDVCRVQGNALTGFSPPLAVVRTGATVNWTGSDIAGHENVEGGALASEDPCFHTRYAGALGDEVALRLQDGALVAEHRGVGRVCASAVLLPSGEALLTYQCPIHPLTMRAALLVAP